MNAALTPTTLFDVPPAAPARAVPQPATPPRRPPLPTRRLAVLGVLVFSLGLLAGRLGRPTAAAPLPADYTSQVQFQAIDGSTVQGTRLIPYRVVRDGKVEWSADRPPNYRPAKRYQLVVFGKERVEILAEPEGNE